MKKNISLVAIAPILVAIILLTSLAAAQDGDQKLYLPIVRRGESSKENALTICLRIEPGTLYVYGISPSEEVLQSIYDGPIDTNSYSYQPIILEKIPSLQDGDIIIHSVTVDQDELIVDAQGSVVSLQPGVRYIPSGQWQPVEYSGGSVQMDQLRIDFTLKTGLVWSDGVPLTAHDSVYAFDLIVDPDTISGPKFAVERTSSYKALDDFHIRWEGLPGNNDPNFLTKFFGPSPKHIWGKYTPSQLLTADVSALKPVGWGPYIIDEWVKGDHIRLSKNPNYFRASEGLPKFETLIYKFIGTNSGGDISSLLSGDCDILESASAYISDFDTLLSYDQKGIIKAVISTTNVWEHLDFGIQHIDYDDGYNLGIDRPNYFGDVRTRRAFAYCIDRQKMVKDFLSDKSVTIDTYLPDQHPYFNSNSMKYEYDPVKAKELLNSAGWMDTDNDGVLEASGVPGVVDGTRFDITLETTKHSLRQKVAETIAMSLSQCGINVNPIYYDNEIFYRDGPDGLLFGRKFELAMFAWLTGINPPCNLYHSTEVPGPIDGTWLPIMDPTAGQQLFGIGWAGGNEVGYFNPDYDSSCSRGNYSVPGDQTYNTSHMEAQRIFAEDLPVLPIFLGLKFAATRPDLNGLLLNPTENTDTWNIEEFSISP
jgi:peptide/nickel transport system substrate-binding protein